MFIENGLCITGDEAQIHPVTPSITTNNPIIENFVPDLHKKTITGTAINDKTTANTNIYIFPYILYKLYP
jgi:hypothetical protein